MSDRALKAKCIYDPFDFEDGTRVLVDREWPAGLRKREANIGLWARELAPSFQLEGWFNHNPDRWDEFQKRYALELNEKSEALQELFEALPPGNVTFVFTAYLYDDYNAAVALKNYVERRGLLD